MDIIKTRQFTLRVHWAGLLLLVFAVLVGQAETAACLLLALILHEAFHLVAVAVLKAPLHRLELTPFGGMMEVDGFQALPSMHRAYIAAAGVLGSLMVGLACRWGMGSAEADAFWATLGRVSLWLAFWNALPALPMDGGQVLAALGDRFSFGQRLRKGLMVAGAALGLGLLGLAAYGAWQGHVNITLIMAGPYLCYAARQSYLTSSMRLVEESLHIQHKLHRGGSWKVDGIACPVGISRQELLKLWLALPPANFHYLIWLEPHSGKVQKVMEEAEVIAELLKGES